ncbi:MAG: FeoA family protein [Bacilli bacterium]
MKLAQLKERENAIVSDCSALCPFLQKRLQDFGVREGSAIEVVRKQPFKGPLQLNIDGMNICLRYADCQQIYIEHGEHSK